MTITSAMVLLCLFIGSSLRLHSHVYATHIPLLEVS